MGPVCLYVARETVHVYSLPQDYLHRPAICQGIVAEHLDNFPLLPGTQMTHYIDDIMIQTESQEIVDEILQAFIQYMKGKGWEINRTKVQGPAQQVKALGIHWNQGR